MSEEREAEKDGATIHRNSGRGVIEKGDARLGPFCIDYKEYAETFGVSRAVWSKVSKDAFKMRRVPALKLVLGTAEPKTRLWVISDSMFHEMYEAWEEKYGRYKEYVVHFVGGPEDGSSRRVMLRGNPQEIKFTVIAVGARPVRMLAEEGKEVKIIYVVDRVEDDNIYVKVQDDGPA